MTEKTVDRIIDYIAKHGPISGNDISRYLGDITTRAVRKHLKNLLEQGRVVRVGKPPKVYYSIAKESASQDIENGVGPDIKRTINERYLYITPTGEMKSGWEGFAAWCEKTNLDPIKTSVEYVATLKKYDAYKKGDLIDGMDKFKLTFPDIYVDSVFYLDFYAIERFGKTKLGQLLLYAKQSQNKNLIRVLVDEIKPRIEEVVRNFDIDGILFIPPTVKREVQFMKELENYLNLSVRKVSVAKLKTNIMVPQKTLNKLEDRIENAGKTIIVEDNKTYRNILIIDDAIGSGSTINETARQIREKKLSQGKVIGLAITGSFKGFDVISEV